MRYARWPRRRDILTQSAPERESLPAQAGLVQHDIPILLYGLHAMGETTNLALVCTRIHCVDALCRITGTNVGYNYSDWAKWWKEKHGTEPVQWKPEKEPES